jgi:hypothetical protein
MNIEEIKLNLRRGTATNNELDALSDYIAELESTRADMVLECERLKAIIEDDAAYALKDQECERLKAECERLRESQSWRPASEPPKAEEGCATSRMVLVMKDAGTFTDDFYCYDMGTWWKTRHTAVKWTELPKRDLPPMPEPAPATLSIDQHPEV